VLEPPRFASINAGKNETAIETITIIQSSVVTCMFIVPEENSEELIKGDDQNQGLLACEDYPPRRTVIT
jgi:hypothetical protein